MLISSVTMNKPIAVVLILFSPTGLLRALTTLSPVYGELPTALHGGIMQSGSILTMDRSGLVLIIRFRGIHWNRQSRKLLIKWISHLRLFMLKVPLVFKPGAFGFSVVTPSNACSLLLTEMAIFPRIYNLS